LVRRSDEGCSATQKLDFLRSRQHSLKDKGEHIMEKVTCPVCNADFDLPEGAKEGDQVTCPICGAELKLVMEDGKLVAVDA